MEKTLFPFFGFMRTRVSSWTHTHGNVAGAEGQIFFQHKSVFFNERFLSILSQLIENVSKRPH